MFLVRSHQWIVNCGLNREHSCWKKASFFCPMVIWQWSKKLPIKSPDNFQNWQGCWSFFMRGKKFWFFFRSCQQPSSGRLLWLLFALINSMAPFFGNFSSYSKQQEMDPWQKLFHCPQSYVQDNSFSLRALHLQFCKMCLWRKFETSVQFEIVHSKTCQKQVQGYFLQLGRLKRSDGNPGVRSRCQDGTAVGHQWGGASWNSLQWALESLVWSAVEGPFLGDVLWLFQLFSGC